MKHILVIALVAIGLLHGVANEAVAEEPGKQEKAADFTFADTAYFQRYTKEDLLEYTPEGQKDLNTWTDMVTVNVYRKATDGDALASVAEAVLGNYKANNGVIVKTDSVPRTNDKPAQHLIVVVFATPEYSEIAFARFLMRDAVGVSVVYSHRIYGKQAGEEMKTWDSKNGMTTQTKLMHLDSIPKLPFKN